MSTRRLAQAIQHLKHGGVIVYPTETAYGLGADATNPVAVRALFRLKGRSQKKTLPLIVDSTARAKRIARFSPLAKKLARTHWPGPLTLVLSVRPRVKLAPGVVSRSTVAVRVSSHPIVRALAKRLRRPLISTSANRAGKPACYSISALKKQFGKLLDSAVIIDGGALPRRKPSTIVRIRGDRVEIIRQGSVRA